MTKEQYEMLKQPFKPNEVQWRLMLTTQSNSGLAVPYLDSRAIQKRLDAVIGFDNWQNSYQTIVSGNNNDPTAHICTISIYNEERGEWVSKSNGAGNTDIEPIKGGLSDAFKRAASSWGIGRYLYDFEGVWVNVEMQGKSKVIAKADRPKLDKAYNDTVRKLFPNLGAAAENKQNPPQPAPVQNNVQQQQPQQQAKAIQFVPQEAQNMPCYTIKDAQIVKDYTQIVLDDGNGNSLMTFFKGEAKVGKNQKLTNVILEKKNSQSGDYYVMNNFQLAA